MRNVRPETTSQKIAWAPCEETAPSVSSATIAATVKKTRSHRNSDLRSLLFSARTSADVFMTANAYPPACVFSSSAEPEGKCEPAASDCQGTAGHREPGYTRPEC